MNLPALALDSWQHLLSHTVDDPAELVRLLELPQTYIEPARAAAQGFPLRVPLPYLSRISKGDPKDPLLLQVLPLAQELLKVPGFVQDPLAEADANPTPGVVHKYQGRALLIMTGACAINCRYCFRRHFPYEDNRMGPQQWEQMLDYIRNDTGISEVILSGGDPLAVSDARLHKLILALEAIPHVKRLRIHTRLPVMIPQRVTQALTDMLQSSRLNSVVVLHVNHANEVDDQVRRVLSKLRSAGVTLLNQAVLLRGINDSSTALQALSHTLFDSGVLPYYLFVLDAVEGAAHFDVPDEEAQQLLAELQRQLPGYLVPRLAREIPGQPAKTLLPPLVAG